MPEEGKQEQRGISLALKESSWRLIRRALDLWVTFDDSPEKEQADEVNRYIDTRVKAELARRRLPKQ